MLAISTVVFYCTITIIERYHTLDIKIWQDDSSLGIPTYTLKESAELTAKNY